jgi:hypothetical protein
VIKDLWDYWDYKNDFAEEVKEPKKDKEHKYKMFTMWLDEYEDVVDEYYDSTTSIKEANKFLDETEGFVEADGKVVGFNWGEVRYVKLDKNGIPKET